MEREVSFQSFDGLTLSGTFQDVDEPSAWAILVHGITADREEWGFFSRLAMRLAAWNIASLRFDYRCHGVSAEIPMTDLSLSGMSCDLDAAAQWLAAGQVDRPERLIVVGVSFGAGIAAEWASRHRDKVSLLVLCSPVLDYLADLDSCAAEWRSQLGAEGVLHYGNNTLSRALVNEYTTWVRLLDASWPNTVIFHGDSDHDVPVERSRAVSAARGIPLIEVSGADHGFVAQGDFDAETEATFDNYEFVFEQLRSFASEALGEQNQ